MASMVFFLVPQRSKVYELSRTRVFSQTPDGFLVKLYPQTVIDFLTVPSVAEPEPGAEAAGAATFRAAPEQEPIFLLVRAGSRSRTF